jgi:hypothetical protein
MLKRLFFSFIGIVLLACNDIDPNLSPNPDYTVQNRYGNFTTDTLYAVDDSVLYRNDPNTFGTTKISVGKYGDFNSSFLIAFSNDLLPTQEEITTIDSVEIEFTTINNFGEEKNINVDIYRVDSPWRLAVNQDSLWKNRTDSIEFISTEIMRYADSSKNTYSLPVDLFDRWRNSTTDNRLNNGLYFTPSQGETGNIIELISAFNNNQYVPNLTYFYRDTVIVDSVAIDSVIAISIPGEASASIFNYDKIHGSALAPEDDKIIISSGIVTKSLLKFNFSTLPENAIYYSADLQLFSADVNDYENEANNSGFVVNALEDIVGSSFTVIPNRNYILEKKNNKTSFNLFAEDFASEFIQSLQNKALSNKWLLTSFVFENREISVVKFFGSNSMQESKPRLVIKYLLKDN